MIHDRVLIIPVGIPCSGKTTLRGECSKRYPDLCIVSPDDLRMEMLDYEHTGIAFDPAIEDEVWERAFNALARCACLGKNIFFDATNLTVATRRLIIEEVDERYEKIAIFLDVPPEIALKRMECRERKIPEERMYQMQAILENPSKCESFDRIERRQMRVI